ASRGPARTARARRAWPAGEDRVVRRRCPGGADRDCFVLFDPDQDAGAPLCTPITSETASDDAPGSDAWSNVRQIVIGNPTGPAGRQPPSAADLRSQPSVVARCRVSSG